MPIGFESQSIEICKIEIASDILRDSGSLTIRVLGASMIPAIWPGDVVTIENCGHDQIHIGSIALFARGGRFFIHRITKIIDRSEFPWISRGDATAEDDPAWSDGELMGRVCAIERRGRSFSPENRVSLLVRIAGRLLCHSNRLRSLALRVHFFLSEGYPDSSTCAAARRPLLPNDSPS